MKTRIIYGLLFIVSISFFHCDDSNQQRKIKLSEQTLNQEPNEAITTTLHFDAREQLSIAVLFFKNKTGDKNLEWLQKGLTEMLIRALSQSSQLSVLGTDRLLEIFERLNKTPKPENLDFELAAFVGREANVKAVLMGHITRQGESLKIEVNIQEPENGMVLKKESVEGPGLDYIFSMVDHLSQKIKTDLQIALEKKDAIKSIADITTNSIEAWQEYTIGKDLQDKLLTNDAIPHFEIAIQHDSAFVATYLDLAQAYLATGERESAYKISQKLLSLKQQATEQERYRIDLLDANINNKGTKFVTTIQKWLEEYPNDRDANYMLASLYRNWNNHELAIKHMEKVIAVDPKYKLAYNTLSYTYAEKGNTEKAIAAAEKYIELAPDEANPYDTMGDINLLFGDYDKAKKNYKIALKKNEDFIYSIESLANVNIYLNQNQKAIRLFKKYLELADDKFHRRNAYEHIANTYLRIGNIDNAIEYYGHSLQENIANFLAIQEIKTLYLQKGDSLSLKSFLQDCYHQIHELYQTSGMQTNWLSLLSYFSIGYQVNVNQTISILEDVIPQYKNRKDENFDESLYLNLNFFLTLLYGYTEQYAEIDSLWTRDHIFPSTMGEILRNIRNISFSGEFRMFGRLNDLFYHYLDDGIAFYEDMIHFSKEHEILPMEIMHRLLYADLLLFFDKSTEAQQQLIYAGAPTDDKWMVIGPFEFDNGFHKAYIPEKKIELAKTYCEKKWHVKWQQLKDDRRDGFINFRHVFDQKYWKVGYGLIYIESPDAKEVQFRFGSDDQVKVWLNNQKIWAMHRSGPAILDYFKVNVAVKKGLNKVLVKVCNTVGDWGYFFRVTDESGYGIPDIKFVSPQDTIS